MCGVFALFLKRPLEREDIELGRRGCKLLVHRGPDAGGEWIDREAGVYLGHQRLSILDPEPASNQPMERGGFHLSYNGEIYNYRELRSRLEDTGVQFTTTGDTEVLLQTLRHHGEEALGQLDGMFAFALWDGRKATLAVDPFGEKTLFWCQTPQGVYVSSELAPLAKLVDAEEDFAGDKLAEYLALGHVLGCNTAYRSIRRLPPASTLTIEGGVAGNVASYWTPPHGVPGKGRVEPLGEKDLQRISDALSNSLERRLRSDVPLCLFLSQGIDSSLIAALARRELQTDLQTLTIAFPGGQVRSEANGAAEVAQYFGHPHQVIDCQLGGQDTSADALLDIYGEPHDNISVFPVLQMAKAAAERFKVALTGTGGDELFFGYNKHWFFYRLRKLFGLPGAMRTPAGFLARPFADRDPRASQLANVVGLKRSMFYFANKNDPAGRWLAANPGIAPLAEHLFGCGRSPVELQVPRFELTNVLPFSQLSSMDLGSMQHSIELRTPFLSRPLLDLLSEFDPRAFMAFGQKSVLRRILARFLPSELSNFPKSGLVFPASAFLRQAGDVLPFVPGIDRKAASYAWARRFDGPGWTRIAVRLAVAEAFHRRMDSSAR